MTTDQYAQALRNQLTTQQLINAVAGTDFMLPGESDQLAALVFSTARRPVATLDVNALAAKQTATDDEINAFYQQNQARFMAPEQFRVSYIKMDAASMQENVSDEEFSHGTTSIRISSLSRSVTATASSRPKPKRMRRRCLMS